MKKLKLGLVDEIPGEEPKLTLLGWLVVLGFLVSVAAVFILPRFIKIEPYPVVKHVTEHPTEYTAMVEFKQIATSPYIRGKIVVVDIGEKAGDSYYRNNINGVSEIYYWKEVWSDLSAKQMEELGTVVLLRWYKENVGTYKLGGSAYRVFCEAILVDKVDSVIVGKKVFTGDDPPDVVHYAKENRSYIGPLPGRSEIAGYLMSLPRR